MHTRIALLAFLLAGCSNTISGSVDGDTPGSARSAIFDEIEIDLGFLGEYRYFAVMLTDFPDACEFIDEVNEVGGGDCDARCAAYGELADEYLGKDEYFTLGINIRADGEVLDTFAFHDNLGEQDTFNASYTAFDVRALYDEAACEDECGEGDPLWSQSGDDAENGSVEVTEWTAGELLEGEYEIGFGGNDELKGSFKAEHCNMDDWF